MNYAYQGNDVFVIYRHSLPCPRLTIRLRRLLPDRYLCLFRISADAWKEKSSLSDKRNPAVSTVSWLVTIEAYPFRRFLLETPINRDMPLLRPAISPHGAEFCGDPGLLRECGV